MTDPDEPTSLPNPDHIMEHARGLYRVVTELNQAAAQKSSYDNVLVTGAFFACPILLSFAIEIALKACIYLEKKSAPNHIHNLLTLFETLDPSTQELLEEGMRDFERFTHERFFQLKEHPWKPMRGTLDLHQNTYTNWRYPHEKQRGEFQAEKLDHAFLLILDYYNKLRKENTRPHAPRQGSQ